MYSKALLRRIKVSKQLIRNLISVDFANMIPKISLLEWSWYLLGMFFVASARGRQGVLDGFWGNIRVSDIKIQFSEITTNVFVHVNVFSHIKIRFSVIQVMFFDPNA